MNKMNQETTLLMSDVTVALDLRSNPAVTLTLTSTMLTSTHTFILKAGGGLVKVCECASVGVLDL